MRVEQLAQLASFPSTLVCSRLDLSGEPSRGGTPLHRAAKHGHVEVVALLLRSGASAEVEDKDGRRPQSCRSQGTVSGRRADAFYLPSTFVQVDPFPFSA